MSIQCIFFVFTHSEIAKNKVDVKNFLKENQKIPPTEKSCKTMQLNCFQRFSD